MLTFDSFGFIKYHNFDDAENCIRGFHFLGYEVSFARVSSPISQLISLSDPSRSHSTPSSRSSPTKATQIFTCPTFPRR